MQRRSFAAVLDDALRCAEPEAAARPASPWAWRKDPPLGSAFLFARPLITPAPRWPAGTARPPRRPAHRFTDEQQLAFHRMVTFGAELADDFSADDLRREYRRLARRYHPDGHGNCSDLVRSQLARAFVQVTEDYRTLGRVVEPRH